MKKQNVIAIDGPAGAGKSEIARRISAYLKIPYINTGSMYRAIAKLALDAGIKIEDFSEKTLNPVLETCILEYKYSAEKAKCVLLVNGQDLSNVLHSTEISQAASIASAVPEVRQWLLSTQRKMASLGMIVMEGRDIGTVIFPNAKYKFFLTASPEVRAKRRLLQLGKKADEEQVRKMTEEIKERDRRDMTREIAPLKQAKDAIVIDTTFLSLDDVLKRILEKLEA